MVSLSYKPVKDIGYNPPVGINIDDHEFSKFDKYQIELENNELEPDSDVEDDEEEEEDEYQATTDTDTESNSEVSDHDYKTLFFGKKKQKVERVYNVILQEEDFLPE